MSLPYSERSFAYPQPFELFGPGDGAHESQLSQYAQLLQLEKESAVRPTGIQAGSLGESYLPDLQVTDSQKPHDVTINGGNGHEDVVSGIKPQPGETLPELLERLHPQLSQEELNEEVQQTLKYNKDYGNNIGDGTQLDPNKTVFLTSVEYTDAEGRPTRIDSPTGRVTEFSYDGSGLAGYKITEPNGLVSEQVTRGASGQWLMTRPDGSPFTLSNVSVDPEGDITDTDSQGDKIGHLTRGDDIYTKYSGSEPVGALTEREGRIVSRYQYEHNGNSESTDITYADNPSLHVLLDPLSQALQRARTAQGEDPAPGGSSYSSSGSGHYALSPGEAASLSNGNATMDQYATDLLQMLGLPVTAANIEFMEAWQKAEGGSAGATGGDAAFNPFNTTQGEPGATSINSAGVKNYTSLEQGLEATASTLENGYYTGILTALRQGTNPMTAAQALAASPWGTGSLAEQVLSS